MSAITDDRTVAERSPPSLPLTPWWVGRLGLMGFGLLFLAYVGVTLAGPHLLPASHTSSDEAAYLTLARNILHGTYAVRSQEHEGLFLWHSPALPLLIAPLVWLKLPIDVIRLTGPIFVIASGMVFTRLMRRFTGEVSAVLCGWLLCLYPPFLRLVPELFVEPLALLACLLGFVWLLNAYQRRRLAWTVPAGLAFGVMVLAREEYGYFVIGCIVLSALALAVRRLRTGARPLLAACVVAFAVCVPWLAYTWSQTHVPFYWTAASGESIYWMSSTAPGETGSWVGVKQVFSDPHFAAERPLFERIDRLSQLEGNRALTKLAEKNIEHHPGTFLHHVVQNGERIFLGIPFSFQGGERVNLVFYGLPDLLLLLLALGGIWTLWRRRVRLPAGLWPLVAFGLLSLPWHLPVAAYPRMATLSIPAFLALAGLGLDLLLRERRASAPGGARRLGAARAEALAPEATGVPASGAVAAETDLLDRPEASQTLVRGSVARTAAYIVASLANAAVLPFMFRYLGVVRSGQYVTVVSLSTILAGIVEVGLTGVSLRLYSLASAHTRPKLMRDLLSMRLFFLAVSIALLLAFVLLGSYPGVIVSGFAICAIGVICENVGSTYNTYLSTSLRLGWIAISNVVRQFLIAALMIGLVIAHAPLIWFFVTVVPAGIAQALISAVITRGHAPLTPSGEWRTWLPLARDNASYVIAMALEFVYFRLPLIIVSLMLAGRETGLFGASFRIVETLTLMTGFVLTAAVPLLTRAAGIDPFRHRYGLMRVVEVSMIIGAGMTVVCATGAHVGIDILAGPKFHDSVGLLEVLSLVLVVRFLNTSWGYGLLSIGDYRAVLVSSAAAVVTSILVTVAGIELIGVYGAVIGTVAAEIVLTLCFGIRIRRQVGSAGFPARTTVAVAISAAIACGVLLLPLPGITAPVLAGVVYSALLFAFRAYPPEALALLPWRRVSRPA